MRSLASRMTRTGERSNMPGSRQVRCGSSDSTVPMPTRMASASARIWCTRSRAASPVMPTGLRPARPALPSDDDGKLQQHLRAAFAHPPRMAGVAARGLVRAEPGFDRDPAFAELGVTLPRHLRIDVLQRRHHAGDPGLDDGVDARRRLAVMRARLERHVERCALRGLAGALERLGLGVRPSAGLGPAAADDDAVLDDRPRRPRGWARCGRARGGPARAQAA